MTKKLHISDDLSLPLDFITSTQAILAKKRVGKSYTAMVEAEELLEAGQQVVVLDPTGAWWGLRSSADGKSPGYPITILGGDHGDVQLEATAGATIAEAIVTEQFSAVIDLTAFKKGERLRFAAEFLETLYRLNRDAMHLFLDEADVFAPQKTFSPEQARCLGAADELVRRGGIRGIGVTLISQRPQVLNKDVLSQIDMLLVLRMNHPKDIGAIKDWVVEHVNQTQAKAMLESLPSLPRGNAWVWAPAESIFAPVTIRAKRTFDSGRTPKAGERRVEPKTLAKVDLDRLGKTIADTVERAKANDPKALRARIAELEKQLAAKPSGKVETKTIEKAVIKADQLARIEKLIDRGEKLGERIETKLQSALAEANGELDTWRAQLGQDLNQLRAVAAIAKQPAEQYPGNRPARAGVTSAAQATLRVPGGHSTLAHRDRPQATTAPASDDAPSKMERAMLTALAERPEGLTRKKVRIHTGYADSGPTSKGFARLLAEGWAVSDNEKLVITDAGLRVLGDFTPLPKGDALREHLLVGSRLSTAEKKMLAVLCDAFPRALTRAEIRDRTGYADSGPTSKAFAHLVGLDYVIDEGRAGLRAAEELFG